MVVDSGKTKGALMHREMNSAVKIIFDDRVAEVSKPNRPADGWRIVVEYLNEQ